MLMFSKLRYPILKKYFSTCSDKFLGQCLKHRTLLQLSGNDSHIYLQGLITNDMSHLQGGASSMFAMFLNSKGRVLFDSLIYNTKKENTYFIECDRDVSLSLRDHLLMYKVRRKVNVDCLEDELDIWTVIDNKVYLNEKNPFDYIKVLELIKQNLPNVLVSSDPRLLPLGLRIITPKDFNLIKELEEKISVKIQDENFYKLHRYKLGVGEGVQELTFEKCFPLEANGDYLNGISFHKGCYIGQELTARSYHTGVIRKRLMPLFFQEELKNCELGIPIFPVPQSKKSVGKLQGFEQNTGLGLLRIEEALKADELTVLDTKCKTHRPFWWPSEETKEKVNIV